MYWVKVICPKEISNYHVQKQTVSLFPKADTFAVFPIQVKGAHAELITETRSLSITLTSLLSSLTKSKSVKLLPGSLIGYKPSNSIHLYPTSWNHAPIKVLKYYCICLLLVSSPTSSALPGCFPHCNRNQLTVAQNWPCQICSTWRVEGANCKTRKPETLDRKLETKRP